MATEKWEHQIVEDTSVKKLTESLNNLGKDGWEGTGITVYGGGLKGKYIILLKRKLD